MTNLMGLYLGWGLYTKDLYSGGAFEGLMSGGHVNGIIRYLISKT